MLRVLNPCSCLVVAAAAGIGVVSQYSAVLKMQAVATVGSNSVTALPLLQQEEVRRVV